MCGVFGIIGHPNAKDFLPTVLRSLQHRGHDAAGVAGFVTEGPQCIETLKGIGKVANVITQEGLTKFLGTTFIGHTRYSTRNSVASVREIHPHWAQSMRGRMVIVSNGDLLNVDPLIKYIKKLNVKVYSRNDAEIIAALVNIHIRKNGKRVVQAIKAAMKQVKGGFAAMMMFEDDDRLFAFRDPWGIRTLHIGEFSINGIKCVAFASETCAFDIILRYNLALHPDHEINFTHREVKPGEVLVIDKHSKIESNLYRKNHKNSIGCVFESIYFSRPDSIQRGESFQILRERMGKELFNESPIEADFVTAVPKGGIPAATGFAEASKLPYRVAILEEPSTGGTRSFTTQSKDRQSLATMKYNILKDVVRNKKLVLIDDSIVRGTTTKLLVKNLFDAGAKEVHLRIPCPPYNHPCHYGIETKDPTSLISYRRSVKNICKILGATSLAYLSKEGLYNSLNHPPDIFCDQCLSNQSPIT
ncbi:MAG: amidophosphoribosyltransferase [Deltaproteobacteria bacterium]|nr:amidophosphoribosyltransferase [Deltaproteobacteria bacterium]